MLCWLPTDINKHHALLQPYEKLKYHIDITLGSVKSLLGANCVQTQQSGILNIAIWFAMLQFVNKDLVPIDGLATVKAAYKLWKQSGGKQKPQATGEKWARLSKADIVSSKDMEGLKVHAEAAAQDQYA